MIDFALADAPKLGDQPGEPADAEEMRRAEEIRELTGVSVCEQVWLGYLRNEGIALLAAMRRGKTTAEGREAIDELAAQSGLVVTYEIDPEIVARMERATA